MSKSIVIISNNHLLKNIGGAEVQADLLAKHLSLSGFKVTYLSGDIQDNQYYNGYKLIPLPDKRKALYTLLKDLNADIYYQRGRKKLTGLVAGFCRKNKKKFIFSASMDIDCQRYKFFLRGKEQIDVYNILKNFRKNLINVIIDLYSLWGIRQADLVLSQTNFQKHAFETNLKIKSKVFYNIHPNPSTIREINKRSFPTVLWLANIKSWKQPEIFLKMVKDLSGEKIRFLMAGNMKNESYQKSIDEAESYNKDFYYLGGKTYDESNELINNADIFVNTSKEQEGFPNTFIQAWLRGVPVVSLYFDPDDMIKRNKLGYVANNYENLLKYVLDLTKNDEERLMIGDRAISFSNDNFSVEKKIHELVAIIANN